MVDTGNEIKVVRKENTVLSKVPVAKKSKKIYIFYYLLS
jgi:hypothetical protein